MRSLAHLVPLMNAFAGWKATLFLGLFAAQTLLADDADLKVQRIAIFSSGVGYFEAAADVTGNAEAELTFRTEQINDILKSLIVQDLGGGSIGVVSYASQDPIEKTLRSFGVDITGNPTLGKLLDQLRGEPVELTSDKVIHGVIVGVEQVTRKIAEDTVVVVDVLNVLTDAGIQQFPLNEVGGVKLTNERVANELKGALATLARGHDTTKKSVRLRFDGSGQRKVRVGYLLEAPIWKTTYRLALDVEKDPFLQGWATVENATEEDWTDVKLSLVSGRPISFRMDLYTPIYIPRPLEELELYASLRPPTYERGEQSAILKSQAPAAPAPRLGSMRNEARMDRSALERDGALTPVASLGLEEPESYDISFGDGGVASVAEAANAGELFEYTIKTPVSIPRQHSAMLPIVNQPIKGTKVSIWNQATHPKHPLNGLELENTSGLNLMQGPVTLFDGNVYAGDAKLPDLKPNEKRLVAYALDLSTEVSVKALPNPIQETALRVVRGVIIQTRKYIDEREYSVKNKSDRQRTVLLEQAYGDEWKLIEPDKPYERATNLSRFKLDVAVGQTASQKVKLEQVTDQSIALSSLNSEQIGIYLRSRVISEKLKAALQRLIELQTAAAQAQQALQTAEASLNEAKSEQTRIRENLKTLERNSDAYRRQMQKFDDFETQIEQRTAETRTLRKDADQAQNAVEQFLAELTVE